MSCLNDNCGKLLKLKIMYERELRFARLMIKFNLILGISSAYVLVISSYKMDIPSSLLPDLFITKYIMVGGMIAVNLTYLIGRMVSK